MIICTYVYIHIHATYVIYNASYIYTYMQHMLQLYDVIYNASAATISYRLTSLDRQVEFLKCQLVRQSIQ